MGGAWLDPAVYGAMALRPQSDDGADRRGLNKNAERQCPSALGKFDVSLVLIPLPRLQEPRIHQLLAHTGRHAETVERDAARLKNVERENVVRPAHAAIPVAERLEIARMLESRVMAAHARVARDLDKTALVVLRDDVKR